MPDSYTGRYGLTQPEVGGSVDTWGAKLNEVIGQLDDILNEIDLRDIGCVNFFQANAVPVGYVIAKGQTLNREDYPQLWAYAQSADLVASTEEGKSSALYGPGNGATTFTLPDYRGYFFRAWNDRASGENNGPDAGRGRKAVQADDFKGHTHEGSTASAGDHKHTASSGSAGSHSHGASSASAGDHNHSGKTGSAGDHKHSGTANSAGAHAHNMTTYLEHDGGSLKYVCRTTQQRGGAVTVTTSTNGAHTHSLTINNAGAHTHAITSAGAHTHKITVNSAGSHSHSITINSAGGHTHTLTIKARGGSETRPKNVALIACIRAKGAGKNITDLL